MKVSAFFRKLYDWVVGTAFQLAIASFWEEVSAVIFPPIIFGHWAKPLWDFFEYLSTGLSKLHSSCPEELFELNNVCKSCRVLFIIFGFRTKKSCFLAKKVRQGCQKAILHVYGTHSRRRFPLEFFLSHSEIDRKIPAFCRKIFVRFVRTGFYLSQEAWWGGNKFKEKFLVIFFVQTSIENFSAFWQKFFHGVVKTAFYVSIATFWSFV